MPKAMSSFLRIPPIVAGIVAAILQTAVIGYMVESRASILRSGTDIRLKTLPVDPRDLLRGDYVTLNYPISRLSKDIVVGESPKATGRVRLSVRLQPGADGLWTASEASFSTLPAEPGTVVLRTLPFDYYPLADGAVPDMMFVRYGIERYYVPEGEGKVLEDARNQEELEVTARVSEAGTPQIAGILLRGVQVYEEPLY